MRWRAKTESLRVRSETQQLSGKPELDLQGASDSRCIWDEDLAQNGTREEKARPKNPRDGKYRAAGVSYLIFSQMKKKEWEREGLAQIHMLQWCDAQSLGERSQRKAMPKNAQTTAQLHSSHTLLKQCSKFPKPGFSSMWTVKFQMFKLVLEKAEEPEIKLPTFAGSWEKQESSRKTSISVLLTMPKSLTVWITINCGKCWKRWEYQTTWPASWETYMQVRKQQLELDMEQQTSSK